MMPGRDGHQPATRRGSVLVVVLWALACAALMGFGFVDRVQLEVTAAGNEVAALQARYLARAAVVRGIAQLEADAAVGSRSRDMFTESWFVHPSVKREGWFRGVKGLDLTGSTVDYQIEDEAGRIDVNHASVEQLARLPGFSSELAVQVLRKRAGHDGVDGTADDELFRTPAEVLMLSAASPKKFRGYSEGGAVKGGWGRWTTSFNDDKVNVNTAPVEVLRLIPGMTDEACRAVVRYRDGADGVPGTSDDRPFDSAGDLHQVSGLTSSQRTALSRNSKERSTAFTVVGIGARNNGKVTVRSRATVRRFGTRNTVLMWVED